LKASEFRLIGDVEYVLAELSALKALLRGRSLPAFPKVVPRPRIVGKDKRWVNKQVFMRG
jgi:hypothetical protein